MASREELLRSIGPDMRLDKWFFLRIYGYEITWPGFAEVALQRLEIMGCSKARNYYSCIVAEYEHNREEELKEVASWYAEECRKEWDRKVGEQQRAEKLDNMSTEELLTLLRRSVERA
jgi:hypothetical protein